MTKKTPPPSTPLSSSVVACAPRSRKRDTKGQVSAAAKTKPNHHPEKKNARKPNNDITKIITRRSSYPDNSSISLNDVLNTWFSSVLLPLDCGPMIEITP